MHIDRKKQQIDNKKVIICKLSMFSKKKYQKTRTKRKYCYIVLGLFIHLKLYLKIQFQNLTTLQIPLYDDSCVLLIWGKSINGSFKMV